MVNMMMERTGMGMPGVGAAGMGIPGIMSPAAMPANFLMVPRCTFKMEKCTGGMKITCVCDDKTASGMVQNLCKMLAGGMCSCCMMMNGMMVFTCNLTMGMCKCDMTEMGVTVTCTSGDKACCDMIQASCDCMNSMLKAGCTCCLCMGSTPVCCGSL
jgi:hypothetical protein